jgi:histidinol-phosphatase
VGVEPEVDLDAELVLALELADLADAITFPHFRAADLLVEHKADRSEVTAADRGAEAAIRNLLAEARADHAVLGEEEGLIGPADARARWVVDPIDGNSN